MNPLRLIVVPVYLEPHYENVNIKKAFIDAAKLSMRGLIAKLFFYLVLGVIPYLLSFLCSGLYKNASYVHVIIINTIFLTITIMLFSLTTSCLVAMARKTDCKNHISYADCVWDAYRIRNSYQIIKHITSVMLAVLAFMGLIYGLAQVITVLISLIPGVKVLPIDSSTHIEHTASSIDIALNSMLQFLEFDIVF